MGYQTIIIILLVIITIMATSHLAKKDMDEPFNYNKNLSIPYYSYLRYPRSKFQINQVHNPFYNHPEYIGKYPYYRFMFSPYSSSVYYT